MHQQTRDAVMFFRFFFSIRLFFCLNFIKVRILWACISIYLTDCFFTFVCEKRGIEGVGVERIVQGGAGWWREDFVVVGR